VDVQEFVIMILSFLYVFIFILILQYVFIIMGKCKRGVKVRLSGDTVMSRVSSICRLKRYSVSYASRRDASTWDFRISI